MVRLERFREGFLQQRLDLWQRTQVRDDCFLADASMVGAHVFAVLLVGVVVIEQGSSNRDRIFLAHTAQQPLLALFGLVGINACDPLALVASIFRPAEFKSVLVGALADPADGFQAGAEALPLAAGNADRFGHVAVAQFVELVEQFRLPLLRVGVGQSAGRQANTCARQHAEGRVCLTFAFAITMLSERGFEIFFCIRLDVGEQQVLVRSDQDLCVEFLKQWCDH